MFKEKSALVDIKHYFGGVPDLALNAPPIDVDKHFSDTKDKFYETWSRYEIKGTIKRIWAAYDSRCVGVNGLDAITEPKV